MKTVAPQKNDTNDVTMTVPPASLKNTAIRCPPARRVASRSSSYVRSKDGGTFRTKTYFYEKLILQHQHLATGKTGHLSGLPQFRNVAPCPRTPWNGYERGRTHNPTQSDVIRLNDTKNFSPALDHWQRVGLRGGSWIGGAVFSPYLSSNPHVAACCRCLIRRELGCYDSPL
jgi:hypothetical protein